MTPKYLLFLLIVVLAGILQNTNLLNVYGVKPDLLLAVLMAGSFFIEDFVLYLAAVLLAVILLDFTSGLSAQQAIFGFLAAAGFFAAKNLQWLPVFNNLALISVGTILFYLLSSPGFLFSDWLIVLREVVYNLILGVIFFKFFESWLKMNSMLKT